MAVHDPTSGGEHDTFDFQSDGLKLTGIVHVPDDIAKGERRPGVPGAARVRQQQEIGKRAGPAEVAVTKLGYVALRFDMRGCGDSEGEHARVICLEQVEDTQNALTALAKHPAVDPKRIAVVGTSFGGAVAVYAGGRRRAHRRGDLQWRLGRRRAQVPRPASDAGTVGEVHRHAGGGASAIASAPASR